MTHRETDILLKTEPYKYVLEMINIIAPSYDDSDGIGQDDISHPGSDAFSTMKNEVHEFKFTKEEYLADSEVITGLQKLGVDVDAFWEALLILDYMSHQKFSHGIQRDDTYDEQVKDLIKTLESPDATLTACSGTGKKGSKYTISDPLLLAMLRHELEQFAVNLPVFPQRMYLNENRFGSITERVAYEALILAEFFRLQFYKIKSNSGRTYRRPLLLISRIIFVTRLVSDVEYQISSDRIKGDLKSYPKPGDSILSKILLN